MNIDHKGWCTHPRVTLDPITSLNRGVRQRPFNAIVIHRTSSEAARGTINSWKRGRKFGTHFLICENGNIRQHVSLLNIAWHVGPIRMRCLELGTCSREDKMALKSIRATYPRRKQFKNRVEAQTRYEIANKAYPVRYPTNLDSIGIEIVGSTHGGTDNDPYIAPPTRIMESAEWLISELSAMYRLGFSDIYAHATTSYKHAGEGVETVNEYLLRRGAL